MDGEQFLNSDWLVREREEASHSRRFAERVLMLWERESDPRQARLMEEEEEDDEVGIPRILMGDTQVLAEEALALAWVLGGQEL